MFRIHSNYQEMQADLYCLPNQPNSLQAEMMQSYSGIQSLQNSHYSQPQNYMINCQNSNNQIIQQDSKKWNNLIRQQKSPMSDNFNCHPQAFVNQRPPNTLQNPNIYPSENYLPHSQIIQPNKETQSEQFFLHNTQTQNYRKSWNLSPVTQVHSFAQEPQNVWNGR